MKIEHRKIYFTIITIISSALFIYLLLKTNILGYKPVLDSLSDELTEESNFAVIFLLLFFPVLSIPVVIARQFIGIHTYGMFIPLIIGYTFVQYGLPAGLLTYGTLLPIGLIAQRQFANVPMLSASRKSISLFVLGFFSALLFIILSAQGIKVEFLSIPFIIMVHIIEKFNDTSEEKGLLQATWILLQTFSLALIIYLIQHSFQIFTINTTVANLMIIFTVAFVINILLSMYRGPRLIELIRFRSLAKGRGFGSFMGMNYRDETAIAAVNRPESIALVDDKVAYKKLLNSHAIPSTKLIDSFQAPDLQYIQRALPKLPLPFVIKPAHGAAGRGILIIEKGEFGVFTDIKGKIWQKIELAEYILSIINGDYSYEGDSGLYDVAMIEEKLIGSEHFQQLANHQGLPDIRIMYYRNIPIASMMRVPTAQSAGKANLSQGAIGVAIDLYSGSLMIARDHHGKEITWPYLGETLPNWQQALKLGQEGVQISGLGYAGIDIVYDVNNVPIIMECNAHPGLDIQNVTGVDLQKEFAHINAMQHRTLH